MQQSHGLFAIAKLLVLFHSAVVCSQLRALSFASGSDCSIAARLGILLMDACLYYTVHGLLFGRVSRQLIRQFPTSRIAGYRPSLTPFYSDLAEAMHIHTYKLLQLLDAKPLKVRRPEIRRIISQCRCPAYLKDIIGTSSSAATRTGLRSACSGKYATPRLRTKSVNVPSLIPDLLHGIHCHQTSVLQPALPCSRHY